MNSYLTAPILHCLQNLFHHVCVAETEKKSDVCARRGFSSSFEMNLRLLSDVIVLKCERCGDSFEICSKFYLRLSIFYFKSFSFFILKAALLALYYEETVHWKPKFLSLRKNKAGHDFIQTLNVIFTELVDRGQHSTYAMKIAMVKPHLLLARTKDSKDGSIGKTLSRRMDQWLNGHFESLFNEAKALQLRQKKTMTKHIHDTFKEFDQHMTSGKISNALRCLDETQKGQVLALISLKEKAFIRYYSTNTQSHLNSRRIT